MENNRRCLHEGVTGASQHLGKETGSIGWADRVTGRPTDALLQSPWYKLAHP